MFDNAGFTTPGVNNVSPHVAAAGEQAQAPNIDLSNVARLSATVLGQPESMTATSLRGLNSLGNTCYGNVLLVGLSRLSLVRGWLSSHAQAMKGSRNHKSSCCMTCIIARDLQQLTNSKTREPFPPKTINHIRLWSSEFVPGRQQDAEEAFQFLLAA